MSAFDPRLWLVVLIAWAGAFGMGFFRGNLHGRAAVKAEWDAATAQDTREALVMTRKAAEFNRVAAAARAASAVQANTEAQARAERVYRATEAPAPAVCAVPDGVRDDLAAAVAAANAAR